MANLCNFIFYSISKIEEDTNETNFVAKGYKDVKDDKTIWYFKYENEYKLIIKDNELEVFVNESNYLFNVNKKTEAYIKNDNYLYKASILTNSLVIKDNEIDLNYTLDFNSFKGNYRINVKLSQQ